MTFPGSIKMICGAAADAWGRFLVQRADLPLTGILPEPGVSHPVAHSSGKPH